MTLSPELLREWSLPRLDGDKHARGTVVIAGACRQTPGAVLLAAEAALRLGAGKVQIATTASTAALVAVALPEGYVEALPESRGGDLLPSCAGRILDLVADADAVLMGPGISDPLASSFLLGEVVPHVD
ncbi:NAD(P)H-hydrate dehydratase [Humibacillus xanthopallidus]|uniref:NAD(P)H-hydrate dehydratase n=1 Tax=Humibacillus xanthopallidus TaxID=412689 RepID=UPI00384C35D2